MAGRNTRIAIVRKHRSAPREERGRWPAEEQSRLLVESARDYALLMLDPEGAVVTWSPGAERMTGFAAEEVLGRSGEFLFTPEDRARGEFARELELVRREGRSEDERWHMRKDSSRFWASGVLTAVRDARGRLLGFAKVMRDITERRIAEQRREAQYAVTRILADAADLRDAAPAILRAIGEISEWGFGALWTVQPEEGVLRCRETWSAEPVFADFAAASRATELRRGVGLPGRVWERRAPVWLEDLSAEANFPRLAAAHRAGLRSGFAFPILLRGDVVGVLEFFSREAREPAPDLTELLATIGAQLGQFLERRRAEERLVRSEARQSAILAAALDAIISTDHEGRVVEWNPAAERIFGYCRDEALGRLFAELIIPPELREPHRRGLARYLATGESHLIGRRGGELTGIRKDGSRFPMELAITRIPTDGPPLFTGYLRDITERRQLEEQLRELTP